MHIISYVLCMYTCKYVLYLPLSGRRRLDLLLQVLDSPQRRGRPGLDVGDLGRLRHDMYGCMYMYVCMYVWMDGWMDVYVCMYVCMDVCMYVRAHVRTYVCVYIYIYI